MDNLWYLALAYGVIWIVLLAYLYSIARRQEGLRQEMKAIQEALDSDAGTEGEGDEAELFLTLVQGEGAPSADEGRAESQQ